MARDRHHRTAECLASMVLGAVIAAGKPAVVNLKLQEYLARAEGLLRETDAALLAPRLETLRTDMKPHLH
jgi:hypothetical protein